MDTDHQVPAASPNGVAWRLIGRLYDGGCAIVDAATATATQTAKHVRAFVMGLAEIVRIIVVGALFFWVVYAVVTGAIDRVTDRVLDRVQERSEN